MVKREREKRRDGTVTGERELGELEGKVGDGEDRF